MENAISSFILIAVTVIIGILVFSIGSMYFAHVQAQGQVRSLAQQVSQGLYIQKTEVFSLGKEKTVIFTISDFNYQGKLSISV
ncbi:hypothetical protein CM19_01255 [Candidatus Acidianus copahuensis]|uniref:Uncharacterized protein n=1 Tax=Candidatus Acidianus copahuensis TaxID=1160895 RepID=A0A031LUC9_9CREN|nr:hypothetical protein [Candidatus Acidianus copahuensis]EZQ11431.1 hypothetical protein CM19_01255 [Candidatus Acidianus copahuensis]